MIGRLLRMAVQLIGATLRIRIEDPAHLLDAPTHRVLIFAFWHNRIFLMPYLFQKYWSPLGHPQPAVLISASKDGEKLADVLSRFDLICVRGSTSRRGKEALLELTRLVQAGHDIGITPDGPRGPKYRVQPGVIDLACLTGAPVVAVTYVVSRSYTFKRAWDKFFVPLPFARCTVRLGVPLAVPRDADDALRENKRLELERNLQTLSGEMENAA